MEQGHGSGTFVRLVGAVDADGEQGGGAAGVGTAKGQVQESGLPRTLLEAGHRGDGSSDLFDALHGCSVASFLM